MDYGIYKNIQFYRGSSEGYKAQGLFVLGLSFIIISSLTMVMFSILIICAIMNCKSDDRLAVEIGNWLFSVSYGFQIHLLHLLWLKDLNLYFVIQCSKYQNIHIITLSVLCYRESC